MPAQPSPPRLIPWHRIFGILLSDYLEGTPFRVELEYDLSQHKQLLDVIVIRKEPGDLTIPMPDGLDDLVDHNLISFKSFHEPLDDWALKELTGHYVNYRKQMSGKTGLLPEAYFHLYAVCARTPRELLKQIPHEMVEEGVYDCQRGTDRIRVVVAGELPLKEKNALVHLFSAAQSRVQYGREHYHMRSQSTSTIVQSVLKSYSVEGVPMPYTYKDFEIDLAATLSTAARVRNLSAKDRMLGLNAEEVLSSLSLKDIKKYLEKKGETRLGLKPEEVLSSLSLNDIKEYLEKKGHTQLSKPRISKKSKKR
jgi:hypothetical protein